MGTLDPRTDYDRNAENLLRRDIFALRATLDKQNEETLGRMYVKLSRAANDPNRLPATAFHRSGVLLIEILDAIHASARN